MEEEVRNSQTLSRISSITCVIIFKLSLNCKKGNDFRLDDFQLLFQNGYRTLSLDFTRLPLDSSLKLLRFSSMKMWSFSTHF